MEILCYEICVITQKRWYFMISFAVAFKESTGTAHYFNLTKMQNLEGMELIWMPALLNKNIQKRWWWWVIQLWIVCWPRTGSQGRFTVEQNGKDGERWFFDTWHRFDDVSKIGNPGTQKTLIFLDTEQARIKFSAKFQGSRKRIKFPRSL